MQTQHKIEREASPNASQRQAIQKAECPLLIIAGHGSGKTFTLVERAARVEGRLSMKFRK